MANLWQFFGLPDPEGPIKEERRKATRRRSARPQDQQTLTDLEDAIRRARSDEGKDATQTVASQRWSGPLTPDGDPFHDLGDVGWRRRTNRLGGEVKKALRYIMPDEMHRLPLKGMAERMKEGDILIVDLRSLIHMDAHQSACRRMLRELGNEHGVVVFALDDDEKVLLVPGMEVSVDLTRHELGISSPMIL